MATGRGFSTYAARGEFGAINRNHLTSPDLLQAPLNRRPGVALKSVLQNANMRGGKNIAVVYMVVRSAVAHRVSANSGTETDFWPNAGLYGYCPGYAELYWLFFARSVHQPF